MIHAHNDPSKLDAAFRMIGIPIEQMKLKANEIFVSPYKVGTFKMPQEYIDMQVAEDQKL